MCAKPSKPSLIIISLRVSYPLRITMKSYSFSHYFKGLKSREVSQGILKWLATEGSKVKTVDDGHIRAIHGKGWIMVQDRNAKKIMNIFLLEKPEGVDVVAHVKPSLGYFDDAPRCEKEIEASWSALLQELWATVEGGELAARTLQPISELKEKAEARKRKSKRSIIWGMLINLVWIGILASIIGLFGYQSHNGTIAIMAVLGPLMALGISMALWGFAHYLTDVNELRRVERMERGG